MQKILKKFEIEEYGTNFTKDVYDPKKIGDDSCVDDKKVLKPTVPNVCILLFRASPINDIFNKFHLLTNKDLAIDTAVC
jgi:hypothetical protein